MDALPGCRDRGLNSCGVGRRTARLRDHPFMQTHMRIRQLLREGRAEAASAMELELARLIDAQQAPEHAD